VASASEASIRRAAPAHTGSASTSRAGPSRHAGGEAVVHQHHVAVGDGGEGPAGAEALDVRHDLGVRARGEALEHLRGDAQAREDRLVGHPDPTFRDRADAVLLVAGRADLPGHEHVERRAEGTCHLGGHGHAPARQAEHDRVPQPEGADLLGHRPTGVRSVLEPHGADLPPHSGTKS
jgi:hypothetical protein